MQRAPRPEPGTEFHWSDDAPHLAEVVEFVLEVGEGSHNGQVEPHYLVSFDGSRSGSTGETIIRYDWPRHRFVRVDAE